MNNYELEPCLFTHVFKDFGHETWIKTDYSGLWNIGCNCGYRGPMMATKEQAIRSHNEARERHKETEMSIDEILDEAGITPGKWYEDYSRVWSNQIMIADTRVGMFTGDDNKEANAKAIAQTRNMLYGYIEYALEFGPPKRDRTGAFYYRAVEIIEDSLPWSWEDIKAKLLPNMEKGV